MKILILCTGNSCRSQMAEGFLRSFSEKLDVYSAGTKPEKTVNTMAVAVMFEKNIDITDQFPEPVENYTGRSFDYVITVCDNAKETCPVFTGKVKKKLHIGFEDPANAIGRINEQIKIYQKVRDQIYNKFWDLFIKELQPQL